jgi:asparagine synthase (glutamine-hydrolysing)
MCGIAGALLSDGGAAHAAVRRMNERMEARGPDDVGVAGFRAGDDVFAVLGSRRLAVIDPSPAGHQPMIEPERGIALVFNGMIYNFRELRDELIADGESFRSSSDTEVVLRTYARYGLDGVRRLRGMFAFAIWDGRTEELFLARDRLGIKPLYYTDAANGFLFASQVRALLASGRVPFRLSESAVRTYLSYGAVDEPLTAIDHVYALPAGCTARVSRTGSTKIESYWDFPSIEDRDTSGCDLVAELEGVLTDSVQRHLISDAPIGVFLSGGLDSSLVAALATNAGSALKTVSVVFDEPSFSEAVYADAVARHIESEHIKILTNARQLAEWSADAFEAMDQPTFDGINTYVVSRAASGAGLKVSLSGLGADELFDGYDYMRRIKLLERAQCFPAPVRRAAAPLFGRLISDKITGWLADPQQGESSYGVLRRVFMPEELEHLVLPRRSPNGLVRLLPAGDLYNELTISDLRHYTRNVLLRDADSMSMANGLEVRVPYLDDVVVDWALRLPGAAKGDSPKKLLKDVARRHLPNEILSRSKQGFTFPLHDWMRGHLRDEVGSRLRSLPTEMQEFIQPALVERVWDRFLRDGHRWVRPWSLFALAQWIDSAASEVASSRSMPATREVVPLP